MQDQWSCFETVPLHQNCSCFLELRQVLVFLQFFSPTSFLLKVCALFHHSLLFFSHLLVYVSRVNHLQEGDHVSSPVPVSVGLGQRWHLAPGAVQEVYHARVWSRVLGKGRASGSGSCEAHKWNEAQPCDVPGFLLMFDQHS